MSYQFVNNTIMMINKIAEEEKDVINEVIDLMYNAVKNENIIHIFGASHASIIASEVYYRAGGFMLFNPIFARELSLDNAPITLTSQMERLEGYGNILSMKADFRKDDILFVHSVSGRNAVVIDLVNEAKKQGVKIVSITNVAYSESIESRHSSGKRLFEISDYVIDNHGDFGDATCSYEETDQKVGATSTIMATVIMNILITELAQRMLDDGIQKIPFFHSANIDGGTEKNEELYELYKDQIKYAYK